MTQTALKILECRPDSYQGWYQQANLDRDRGCYFEALLGYEKALEYYPDDYWSWYRRGKVLEILGRYSEANQSYTLGCQIKPKNYWCWYEQGYLNLKYLKDYHQAIICFNHALSRDGVDYWANYRLGDAWRLLGDYPTAIAYYEEALSIRRDDYWANYRRNELLLLVSLAN